MYFFKGFLRPTTNKIDNDKTTTTYSQVNERSMKKKIFNIRVAGIYRWLVTSRVHRYDRPQTKGENNQCLLLQGLSESDRKGEDITSHLLVEGLSEDDQQKEEAIRLLMFSLWSPVD